MLNALSRAALGALKAGKSNLTPKIVQNELPKAMVATTSTCEYILTRYADPTALSAFVFYRRHRSFYFCDSILTGERERCSEIHSVMSSENVRGFPPARYGGRNDDPAAEIFFGFAVALRFECGFVIVTIV